MPRLANVADQPPAPALKGPSLSQLIVGEPNATGAAVVHQVAAGERVASPLLLWGASGVGKTHLVRGLRQEVRRHNRRVRALYITAEQFCTAFVEAVQARGLPSFRNKHRGVELLIVDDVQFLSGKTKTVEELLYTIDTLATAGATIVLTSDRPPAALAPLSQELASRLAGGLAIEVGSPDHGMRKELVAQLAATSGEPLPEAVIDEIAAGVVGGARELSGVVNRLAVEANLLDRQPTPESARRVIEQTGAHTTPQLRLSDIQTAVCRVFGIERSDLRGGKRTKAVAEPRMLAMWLSRKYTPAAWSEIGAYYGRRSHSTVISACRRVDTLLGRSADVHGANGNRRLEDALRQVEVELRTA
ncbi:MAG: DnaA/Hda family protein [Planctomycetota bacterium]